MSGDKTNVTDAVMIPAAQALVSGLFAAGAAGGVAWLLNIPGALAVALAVLSVVSLVSWFGYRESWERRAAALAGVLEELSEPKENAQTVRVEIIADEGRTGEYLALPIDQARLIALARALVAGSAFTHRHFTGKGKLFSSSEYEELRDELVRRGMLAWASRDHRGGVELTRAGFAVMRHLSSCSPTYPPTTRARVTRRALDKHTTTQQPFLGEGS
jgi:hypothetical protein